MKRLISIIIFTLSINAYSYEQSPEDKFYNDLLDKHQASGQLNKGEIEKQKFKYSNNKDWQKKFNKQVRGVASKINKTRDVIELKNQVIEISVK